MESLLLSAKLHHQVQVLAIDDDTQLLSGWPLALLPGLVLPMAITQHDNTRSVFALSAAEVIQSTNPRFYLELGELVYYAHEMHTKVFV
jgi:hypothetical protein